METGASALGAYPGFNRANTSALAAGRSVTPPASSAATFPASTTAVVTPSNLTSTAPVSASEVQISQRSGRTNAPLQPTADEAVDQQPRQSAAKQQNLSSNAAASRAEVQARVEQEALERQEIRQLAEVDHEVRAHEAAHAAAGGQHAGAPSYEFTRGPDGRLYAVAGEVSIDTRPVANDPQATIEKAQTIIRAATAPADPSPQDRRVAAEAQAMLAEAQAQLALDKLQGEEAESSPASQESASSDADAAAENADSQPVLAASAAADDADNSLAKEVQPSPAAAVEQRLERAKEQRENFAEQLQALNQGLNRVQQQLIDSGVVNGFSEPGSLIDVQA